MNIEHASSTDPIIAWKRWNAKWWNSGTEIVPRLQSRVMWTPYEAFEATCQSEEPMTPHLAPSISCQCGIYATSTPPASSYGEILGRIALWGTVIEAESGYVAQYAYPTALLLPTICTCCGEQTTNGEKCEVCVASPDPFGSFAAAALGIAPTSTPKAPVPLALLAAEYGIPLIKGDGVIDGSKCKHTGEEKEQTSLSPPMMFGSVSWNNDPSIISRKSFPSRFLGRAH